MEKEDLWKLVHKYEDALSVLLLDANQAPHKTVTVTEAFLKNLLEYEK